MRIFGAENQLHNRQILFTITPLAVDQNSRELMIKKLKHVFQDICSHADSSPKAIRSVIKGLSLIELAHVNIGVQDDFSELNLNCTPLLTIESPQLFNDAAFNDSEKISHLVSKQLSESLSERISSMSKLERKDFVNSLIMLEKWDENLSPKLYSFLKGFLCSNPKMLANKIIASNPVRILEAVRLLEEPLSASFVFNKKIQENYNKLRLFKKYDIGTHLSKALKGIYQCLREYENFGSIKDVNALSRVEGQVEVVLNSLLAWRGSSEHQFFKSSRTKEEVISNTLNQLYQINMALSSNNYRKAVANVRSFEIKKAV